MAFTLAAGDVLECRAFCGNGRQISINTIHLAVESVTIATATLQEVADAVARYLSPDFVALLSENADIQGWKVRRVLPTKTKAIITAVGSGAGTVAGDVLPGQVAGMLQLATDDPGAGSNGRLYLPFPSEASSTVVGETSAAYVALAVTLGNHIRNTHTYLSDAAAAIFTAHGVIRHRKTAGTTDITGVSCKSGWATRHSRGGLTKGDQPFT